MCSFLVWKNACLNYREFDLEGDLVGVPHTWYLSAQYFIRLLKLVWREYDIVAMNEWKRNMSVCRGHELANALFSIDVELYAMLSGIICSFEYFLECFPYSIPVRTWRASSTEGTNRSTWTAF